MSRHAVLWIVVIAVGMVLPTAQAGAQEGMIYEVVVDNSLGVQFCDCLRFDHPTPGCLSIDGIGRRQLWAHTDLNQSSEGWQSTYVVKGSTCGHNPKGLPFALGFAFHGQVTGPVIMGDGINELGWTFTLYGVATDTCSLSTCTLVGAIQRQIGADEVNSWGPAE